MKKYLLIGIIIGFAIFLRINIVNAIVDGSTAKCVYGDFVLEYKNGTLSHTTKDETGYVTYTSVITIANITNAEGNLQCPSVVYFSFDFNGNTRQGSRVFSAIKEGQYEYSRNLDSENSSVVNKTPTGTEPEPTYKPISCAYGTIVVSSDGKTVTGTVPNNVTYMHISVEELGDTCPSKICYTCARGYCGVGFESNGNSYSHCINLNDSSTAIYEDIEVLNQGTSSTTDVDESRIDNFMSNIIGATANCSDGDKVCLQRQDKLYEEAKILIKFCNDVYVDTKYEKTDSIYAKCEEFDKKVNEFAKAGYFGNRVITNQSGSSCDDVLGALGVWLKKIYDIMKYAVPIIIVVLGIKDFISGTISGKDDALKKAGSTFVKRLIWGAVFVALPVLITMILTFAFGGSFADICIF